MSHEIRTPMNGMLGMIQFLQNNELTEPQCHRVKILHDSTEALLETFDHVLQYAQLEEGGYDLWNFLSKLAVSTLIENHSLDLCRRMLIDFSLLLFMVVERSS